MEATHRHFYFFRTGREINSLHLFIRTTITDMAQQLSQRFNKFQMVLSQKCLVKHKHELKRKVEWQSDRMGTFIVKIRNHDFLAVKINENCTVLRCADVCKNVLNEKDVGFTSGQDLFLSFSDIFSF